MQPVNRRPTTILHIHLRPIFQQLVNDAFLVAGCCSVEGFPIITITAINRHSITQDLDNHTDKWQMGQVIKNPLNFIYLFHSQFAGRIS